ncbi:MAG: efflux RND transporter permease subunit [Candidatus Sumerlaeia bacterium]|nr:efflux RND transporter permease subunit [Candidatus Sumerlaeia bacterium]
MSNKPNDAFERTMSDEDLAKDFEHRPFNSRPLTTEENKALGSGAIAWMCRNGVTPNLVMIFLLVGGALAYMRITKEVFPEFALDAVTVSVSYPGASPEEVEQGIVLALEEAIRGVEDIVEVTSSSREGSGSITAEYDPTADAIQVYQDIQQAVDRIRTFPADAEEPRIDLLSRRRDVMELQVHGNTSEWALRNTAEEVKERLLQTPGVTQVELRGARNFEVHILPRQEILQAYNLTLQEVANRLARTSVEVPGGGIQTSGGELLIRFDERADFAREFASVPIITTPEGAVLTIEDIAEVREEFEDVDRYTFYNGEPAIGISVYRVGDQTPTGISTAVRGTLDELATTLPEGVKIAINDDDSIIFEQRKDLLLRNMASGLILVLIFLGLFLEPRLAFWVMMGIPVSFLGSFIVLNFLGVSINMISMFAFIIALGIVVDDAIVVGENVYEYRLMGYNPMDAAIKGAQDVGIPVVFSVLTNCVTFIPLMLIPGTQGKIWFVIPVVVITVFMISLFESIFILPSHLSHLNEKPRNLLLRMLTWIQEHASGLMMLFVNKLYAPMLDFAIRVRYLVVAVSVCLLSIVIGYAASGRMGFQFFPRVESDTANVTVTVPVGSSLEFTTAVRNRLEDAANKIAAEHENLMIGIETRVNPDSVTAAMFLNEPGIRPISTREVTDLWRKEVGEIPGVETLRFESDRGGPGGGASLTVELSHPNVVTLEAAAERLAVLLSEYEGVADIDNGFEAGKEQLTYTLKPEGRSLGLTSLEVARQIRNSFEGAEAIRQLRERNEVRIRVILPKSQRTSEYDVEQLLIRTPAGEDVPLRQIAEIERGRAYTAINRTDGRRTINVSANVTPDDATSRVEQSLREDVFEQLEADYPGLQVGFGGRQEDRDETFGALGIGFMFSLLGLYTLLAIPFKSYTQPLIVMVAIPFGIFGAVVGHLLMDYSLSVMSMMGIIALAGVVINDSLVMIDYANLQRSLGRSAFEAIHLAGVRRFRPIFLTTATTFGGLAPMIMETSRQARFLIPMAISLGYGLLFATAIILVLIPSLYMIEEDIRRVIRRLAAIFIEPEPEIKPQPISTIAQES